MVRISRIEKGIAQNQFSFSDWESKFATLHGTTLEDSKSTQKSEQSLQYLHCNPQKTHNSAKTQKI